MSTGQLLEMARHPQADIGAHTLSHIQLRGQSIDLKRREVVGSVTELSSMLRRPITSFAYPYGSPRAVDREAQRLAKEAGCDLACSTNAGLVESGRNRYLLPRIAVGNWPAATFAEKVEAVFNR
jgi:peptidoglycan/xylan/chitin deacetylase (PgdA/CDA1 family)